MRTIVQPVPLFADWQRRTLKQLLSGCTAGFLLIVILLDAEYGSGQAISNQSNNNLIRYEDHPQLTPRQQQYAEASIRQPQVAQYAFATMDLTSFSGSVVTLNLFDQVSYTVNLREKEDRANNRYSWFGRPQDQEGSAVFTVNGEMMTGWIHINKDQYSILPLGDGLHLVYEIHQTGVHDESDEGYRRMMQQSEKTHGGYDLPMDPETGFSKTGLLGGNCKVRVAVCYTDNVDAALADPLGFVQSCIDVTNDAYNNSSISFDVELAVAYENTYSETSNADTDLDNFQDTGDGVLDEISDKRIYYDADLAVLVVENMDDYCGLAWTVDVSSYSESYCVVKRSCAVDNYSFPHELGHLYGARHDCYVDGSLFPYSSGHGFINQTDEWRTIMAYNDQCEDDGDDCERIGYFSNPDKTYGGDPMGIPYIPFICTSDNESAHENSRSEVADNEVSVDNKSFPSETFNSGEGGDVIANLSVTNSTSYTINSGAEITWRAGTSVVMAPGFVAANGSTFHAFLDECTELRTGEEAAEMPGITGYQSAGEVITIFPNPFHQTSEVELKLIETTVASIYLLDITGKEVQTILTEVTLDSGNHTFTVKGYGLPEGMYLLHLILNGNEQVEKLIRVN